MFDNTFDALIYRIFGPIIALFVTLFGFFLGGCAAFQKAPPAKTPTEYAVLIETVSQAARENNVSGNFTLHMGGSPEAYLKQSAGIDTGFTGDISINFNPAATPDDETAQAWRAQMVEYIKAAIAKYAAEKTFPPDPVPTPEAKPTP